jgi:cell division initiation protein
MNCTPEKLGEITFCKAVFNGYKKSQVDDELSKIIEDYNENIDKINDLKDRVSSLTEAVERYKSVEEAMQQCLMLAQQTSDDIKTSASEKAKGIIDEAEATSQKLISDATLEVNKIKLTYEDSKSKIYTFKVKSQALLQAQLDVLKQMDDE